MMLRNLAAVAPNYRDAGIGVFVVASSFVISTIAQLPPR
jgi:hypothetical protein